jgi:hypothetical protein
VGLTALTPLTIAFPVELGLPQMMAGVTASANESGWLFEAPVSEKKKSASISKTAHGSPCRCEQKITEAQKQ